MKIKLIFNFVFAILVGFVYLQISAVPVHASTWLSGSWVQSGNPVKVYLQTWGDHYSCSGSTMWFNNDEPWPRSDYWERAPGYWVYSYSSGGYTDFVVTNYDGWFYPRISSGAKEAWRWGAYCY